VKRTKLFASGRGVKGMRGRRANSLGAPLDEGLPPTDARQEECLLLETQDLVRHYGQHRCSSGSSARRFGDASKPQLKVIDGAGHLTLFLDFADATLQALRGALPAYGMSEHMTGSVR
jgi:hypothetical protein